MFRKSLWSLGVLVAAGLAGLVGLAGCAEGEAGPEPGDERADDAAELDDGEADAEATANAYFAAFGDRRACAAPTCGGAWVRRLNRKYATCADGTSAEECYVAEIDWSALGLTTDRRGDLELALDDGMVLLRGAIKKKTFAAGTFGVFRPTEAWLSGADRQPDGVFVRVRDNGLRCAASPCPALHETKLNSTYQADIAALDLGPSEVDDEAAAGALEATFSPDGLIVAGYRYTVSGPAGRAKARTVYRFYTRVLAE